MFLSSVEQHKWFISCVHFYFLLENRMQIEMHKRRIEKKQHKNIWYIDYDYNDVDNDTNNGRDENCQ